MRIEEKNFRNDIQHNVIIEGRQKVTVSAVGDVENFNDTLVTLTTNMGLLIIKGSDLKLEKLNLESGELKVEGTIDLIQYNDEHVSGGFLSRLFR